MLLLHHHAAACACVASLFLHRLGGLGSTFSRVVVRGALHWNVVVVHYHFWLQRLVDHVCLVHVTEWLLLDGWSLETRMHIINLSVGSNRRRGWHLLLGLRLAAVRCYGPA